MLDLLIRTGLNVGAHLDRPTLTQGDLERLAAHERHCVGSDGIYQEQHPHPRGNGAFARLAEHHLGVGRDVRAQRVARHLAANAADAYGLGDRGRLVAGMAADICAIGSAGIGDRASYNDPWAYATGVALVIVNGAVLRREGRRLEVDQFPGQFVS